MNLKHEHNHQNHAHAHAPSSLAALLSVLVLTTVVFFAEFIAGIVSGSLALVADSAHMLSDSVGLLVALTAMVIGRKSASVRATYGYKRVEVMAAVLNAGTVSVISVWIVVEAFTRLGKHKEVDTNMLLSVAIIGLISNVIAALILARKQHDNMNLKGAYLHVLSDMFGSIAVIVAGIIIRLTGFQLADTIASVIIAGLILPRSIHLFWDALRVLLDQVPRQVDVDEVRSTLLAIKDVEGVHDLHVWSIDGTDALVSCHVVTTTDERAEGDSCRILDDAAIALQNMGIEHATVQLENKEHAAHEVHSHN